MLFMLIVFLGIQFVPRNINRNMDLSTPNNITELTNIPYVVQELLVNSCYDCHSNNTQYPWYFYIQPVSMLLGDHIEEGKKELNFNEFGSYSRRRQKSKLKSIASQIKNKDMPLSSYVQMHSDAKLSGQERTTLIEWSNMLQDSL